MLNMKRNKSENQTNWKLCFICQESTNESLRSTADGIASLAPLLVEFQSIGALDFDISRIASSYSDGQTDIRQNLRDNSAQYHHKCKAKYNTRMLDRASKKQKLSQENDGNSSGCSRRSINETLPKQAGILQCCICSAEDTDDNLCAAGTYHASKMKTNISHVTALTEKWRVMAITVGNQFLLNKLACGDVAANDMFYHSKCLKRLGNDYKQVMKSTSVDNNDYESWIKAVAFDKVVSFVFDTEGNNPGTIFRVKDLENMYIKHLNYHNIEVSSHVTRFTEKLISSVTNLETKTTDRIPTVFFTETIDNIFQEHCNTPDSFIRSLRNITKEIRDDVLQKVNKFDGTFDEDSQIKAVPIRLLTLVSMLIDGTQEETMAISQAALTCSQIIVFNCRKSNKEINTIRYHSRKRETPAVIYTSLKIYSTVRCRTLIDHFFAMGICLSYQRVLDITKYLYEKLRSSFSLHNAFLPGVLKKGLFTILAKDNIDKNSTTTMAKSHYHGTSISVLQFTSSTSKGSELPFIETPEIRSASKKLSPLPKQYTEVTPIPYQIGRSDLFAPVCTVNVTNIDVMVQFEQSEKEELIWLQNFTTAFLSVDTVQSARSWAQHHASLQRNVDCTPGINAIMPLLRDPVHTLEMQYHCMEINVNTINVVNPGQTPVDTCDQPVYALTKEVQWRYPLKFQKYFSLMGGLHIEQSLLVIHGQLIRGSGLDKILDSNNFSLIGTSSIVDVNHIKRARYCMKVSLCALYCKLKEAQQGNRSDLTPMEWLHDRSNESEMCFFWKLVINMQLQILIFVRSIREGNFDVYVQCIRRLIKWYFVFDHYNYSRWLTVHLFDLVTLEYFLPDIYEEMKKGNFSFQKTNAQFSRMAPDQLHEQNNKVIKGCGGATNLLNKQDESALIRWETCGPDIARIVSEFEELIDENGIAMNDKFKTRKHHEDTAGFQATFVSDVQKLYSSINCNPFEISKLTTIHNISVSFSKEVYEEIKILEEKGELQFKTYWDERLIKGKLSINAKIKKNKFSVMNTELKSNAKTHTVNRTVMMNKLRSATAYRPRQTSELFAGEVFGVAQSIATDNTSLYHGTKSEIKKRFQSCPPPYIDIEKSSIVIELSPLIHTQAEKEVDNFNDFAVLMYYNIMDIGSKFHRIDVVCDRYFKNSLKKQTRKNRGIGTRHVISDDAPVPHNFKESFLHNSENKNDLNEYLAQKMISLHTGRKLLIVTFKHGVLTSNIEIDPHSSISFCTSEEADQRLVRHGRHMLSQGYQTVIIRTVDTDVLILLIAYIFRSLVDTISCDIYACMCTKGEATYYDITSIAKQVGNDTSEALPFFYSFTGCDTVSSIFGKGKCKIWDYWQNDEKFQDLTAVFKELGNVPEMISEQQLDMLAYFIKKIYSPKAKELKQTLALERLSKFEGSPNNDLRQIPMSRPALLQHTRRASYQAGYLWNECLHNVEVPDPLLWGWLRDENGEFIPCWQILNSPRSIESVISTCTCKSTSCKSCKCSRSDMPCLPFCICQRTCNNNQ